MCYRTHSVQIWIVYAIWILNFLAEKIYDKSHQFLRCISCIFCVKNFIGWNLISQFKENYSITIKSENRNSIRIFLFSNCISTSNSTIFYHCTFVQYNSFECCTNIQVLRKSSRRQNFIILSKAHETSNSPSKNRCLRE